MCRQNVCVLFLFILSVSLIPITEQQGSRTTHKREYSGSEVARQNKITQQILAQYLQKRLFPHLMVNNPPSPSPRGSNESDEALDSDESEQISSHVSYDDEDEEEDEEQGSDCANCVEEGLGSAALNRWTMPLLKLGEKRYYLGIFFKANWYKSAQYCRYHGMHLASISSQQENDQLEKHIRDSGFGHEHFWTSGTDQGEEGHFFWMSTGRPLTFTNWNAGEPNNFRYENGEEEHCLELWNRDGKGLKWNDTPCSFETYFVCEVN